MDEIYTMTHVKRGDYLIININICIMLHNLYININ